MPSNTGSFDRLDALHELNNIADWWLTRALDHHNGGFLGETAMNAPKTYRSIVVIRS